MGIDDNLTNNPEILRSLGKLFGFDPTATPSPKTDGEVIADGLRELASAVREQARIQLRQLELGYEALQWSKDTHAKAMAEYEKDQRGY